MARHEHLHPLLKIVEWLTLIVAAIAVVMIVWLWLPINHADTFNLLLFQAAQAICTFIVPAWIVAKLWSDHPAERLCLKPIEQTDRTLLLLSIAAIVCALPLINCLAYWNSKIVLPAGLHDLEVQMQKLEEQAAAMLEAFLRLENGSLLILLLNIIVLAIIPAIGEEMTFRGVLQPLFIRQTNDPHIRRRNRHIAVWITAFIFSFIHFQFYGFIPRLLLGALLGYTTAWTNNLVYSMTMHATNNTLSVLLFYIAAFVLHLPDKQMDYLGTGDTWWLTAISVPLTTLCVILFFRQAQALHNE